MITNRTVKPFIKAHDFYPGFKLEEECFSKAIISDINEPRSRSKKKGRSDLDQEPMTWPREKSGSETGYERWLEEVINPKTGEFYPEIKDKRPVPKTGCLYYITDIYRLRRADGSEYLYTKGIAYAYDSRGNPVKHSISKPETWLKTNFNYKTEWNDKTKQLEEVLQCPSGLEEIYTMPFTKENLKSLYDIRQNENLNFVVKDEQTGKPFQVKDVNSQKTFELFQKPFEYLFKAEYIPAEVKAELRQAAVSEGLIGGTASDYNQPNKSATTGKNTYQ